MTQENKKGQNLLLRYYKREEITLNCEVITPMFLGNAEQEAEWRAAPFKALFRYWWRVSHPYLSRDELHSKEGELFGSVGSGESDGATKSLVTVGIDGKGVTPITSNFRKDLKLKHPEVTFGDGTVPALLYLAGMGLLKPSGQVNHPYFAPSARFQLVVKFPKNEEIPLRSLISLIQTFGALGARCRNGWGSFQISNPYIKIEDAATFLQSITTEWEKALTEKDYPHFLGKDKFGLLLWKTKMLRPTWEEAMRDLAEAYIKVRTCLDVNGQDSPSERHLLGFPITHHEAKKTTGWGKEARHASPLRFVVRRRANGYTGFILHLPFAFSEKMKIPQVINPIEVWKKVHAKFDETLSRARYEDCL